MILSRACHALVAFVLHISIIFSGAPISSLHAFGTNSHAIILSWKQTPPGTWIPVSTTIFVTAFVIPLCSSYFVPPTMADGSPPSLQTAPSTATVLNNPVEGCLTAVDVIPSDPTIAAALNDSDEDAACLEVLEALEDPVQAALNDSAEEAACLEALQTAEADQVPLEFELIPHVDRRVRKFGLHRRVFTTRLVQRGGALRPELIPRDQLPSLLDQALQIAIQRQVLDQPGVHDNDHLMINMSSNRLQHAYQSSRVRVRDWLQDTEPAQMMMQQISKILNSNENFAIDDSFHIEVSHIRDSGVGSGSRGQRPGTQPIEQFLRNKKSVVRIENDDELCCARALVTAKAYRDWGSRDSQYQHIIKGKLLQGTLARQLHRRARVPEGPCGLGELNLFQIVLSDYQIVVVSADHGYQIIFKGPRQPEDKLLCLIKVQDHYHVTHSLSGFFGKAYFCLDCEKSFNSDDLQHHRCQGRKCTSCHQAHCRDFSTAAGPATVLCQDCKRSFFGADCLLNHHTHTSAGRVAPVPQASVCSTHKRCPDCQTLCQGLQTIQRHKCGYSKCPSCKEQVPTDTHRCYIQPIVEQVPQTACRPPRRGAAAGLATLQANLNDEAEEERTDTTNVLPHPLFLYFDIEARQDTGEHVANLLCAETSESNEQFTFAGESCIEEFLDWCQSLTRTPNPHLKRKVICIAHNFKGYDSYFILEQCYKLYLQPDQLVNGAKILSLSLADLRFLDSLSFLPMPLAAFPKAFGLQELKKGFFPHFFNTQDHQDYIGPIPAQDYYDPRGMSPARKAEFEAWHAERRAENYEFNFSEELLSYCQSDVRLLKEGCTKFATEFEHLAGFNPFEHCVTIASACNRFFRKHCLTPQTIASEPIRGWHHKGKPYSRAALEWLYWQEHVEREARHAAITPDEWEHHDLMAQAYPDYPHPFLEEDYIQHAKNKGEMTLLIACHPVRVDGYNPNTRTAYEFHGCFFHGCPACFPNRQVQIRMHDRQTMHDLYLRTQARDRAILQSGYSLQTMWECEWKRLKASREDIQGFVDGLELVDRLEPRDAFYGGRTEAVTMHAVADPDQGESIQYLDFTSLYPWVNKNCTYPVGHPVILTELGSTDLSSYFGLAKVTVLPPYGLYLPVLPYRAHGKLLFPLCRSCVEAELAKPLLERSHDCPHADRDRALTGTWTTIELEEALAQGYDILKVHEIWHFPQTSTQLFVQYINTFLKVKQEADGWPADVGTDELKRQEYIAAYQQHEGVQLDYAQIEKNPAKRALAKLMLNSFWGKFGQASNKSQVESISSPSKFHRLLNQDDTHIHAIRVVNEEMLEIVYNKIAEAAPIQPHINIVIAAFTTAHARLHLYRQALFLLQPQQVLYMDTDSIIYKHAPGQPTLETGAYLGQFKNELDEGDTIMEFATAGPKNYGYITRQGKVECKVRGFSLNARGQEQLNFDILKRNVLDELQHPQAQPRSIPIFNPHKIVRDETTKRLQTRTEIKRYQLVASKRVVDPRTFHSYPYGFTPAPQDGDFSDFSDNDSVFSL